MSKEPLVEKAREALDLADMEAALKKAGISYKNQKWLPKFIIGYKYNKQSLCDLAIALGVSRGTIYNKINIPKVKTFMEEIETDHIVHYQQRTFNLLDKAMDALENILDDADTDSTKLKAVESILKKYGIFDDKTKIDLTGSISIPNLVIRPLAEDDSK